MADNRLLRNAAFCAADHSRTECRPASLLKLARGDNDEIDLHCCGFIYSSSGRLHIQLVRSVQRRQ
jgi:hypothetical protein